MSLPREPVKHIDYGPFQRAVDALMTYWLNGTNSEDPDARDAMREWWEQDAPAAAWEIVLLVMKALEDEDDIVSCACGKWMRRKDAHTNDVEEPFLCDECWSDECG